MEVESVHNESDDSVSHGPVRLCHELSDQKAMAICVTQDVDIPLDDKVSTSSRYASSLFDWFRLVDDQM